jgi:hypothetical protein
MSVRMIRNYLHARAGQEVSWKELAAASLAPSEATLAADLSRLTADPRNGITRIGAGPRKGAHRSYRYDKPAVPEQPEHITLRLIGQSARSNRLAQDEGTRQIYEIVPAGQLDWLAGPASGQEK